MYISNIFAKFAKLMHIITSPFQFGFVQCHSYLSDIQLDQIGTLLHSKDHAEKHCVVLEFEEQFGKLIGQGLASSFASGRMAFYSIMEALGIGEGDEVVLTAFTCAVMPNAVMKRGARPIYADMDPNTFGSNVDEIRKVITSKTRLIVVQHSFGIPCNIEPIIQLAKERGIYIVEDCAISLDSSLNGIKVGNWGDAAIFSTDHSKPINTMIGGLLYTRNLEIHERVARLARLAPDLTPEHQKNIFEQMMFERRHFIPSRYPRARVFKYLENIRLKVQGCKRQIFLEDNYVCPIVRNDSYPYPAAMPAFLAQLGIFELERWDSEKIRRKRMLLSILEILRKSVFSEDLPAVYSDPARDIVPLRLVFVSEQSDVLTRKMEKYIDINWIWFRQPITCAVEGLESFHYLDKSCPSSEYICGHIINIPCNVIDDSTDALLRGIGQTLL